MNVKLTAYILLALALLIGGLWLRAELSKPKLNEFAQLQVKIENNQRMIDSMLEAEQALRIAEKEIQIKWYVKNEKEIIYILMSADSVQPRIRTDYRTRADSLLARY